MRNSLLAVAVAAVVLAAGANARASQTIWVNDALDILGTVDSATGTTTSIGNMGTFLTDIAFDPSGHLYGVGGVGFQDLFSINITTGLATDLGNSGVPLNSLVFGPTGTLYSAYGTNLYTMNTSTAAVTTVGTTGFIASGDLAFHGGNLYMTAVDSGTTDDLVQINPLTGAGTLIGPIGVASVYGLADGHDGVLYGLVGNHVISINTTTGAGTPVSSWMIFNGSFGNAAGADIAPVTTPEPASLLVLACGAVAMGMRRRGARNRETISGIILPVPAK